MNGYLLSKATRRHMLKAGYENVDLNAVSLETPRLRLRPATLLDTNAVFTYFTADVATYMYPRPAQHRTETEAFLLSAEQELRDRTSLVIIVLDKPTGKFLGCAGLHNIHTKLPEFGIWLKSSAHGRGYGREVIQALRDWAGQFLTYDALVYPVDERNTPSRRIPEAMGGVVTRRYKAVSGLGEPLRIVEYRIYPVQ